MRKEPIALYIFRFILAFGLFAFMLMLYWSSVLIEQDMKGVQKELIAISDQIKGLMDEVKKEEHSSVTEAIHVRVNRPHIDVNLPNLLEEDPFYSKTLPKLLGPHFHPFGNLRYAVPGKPSNLNVFNNWRDVSHWNRLCSSTVASNLFGKFETLAPAMAIKMEERKGKTGAVEFWVHLREGLFWEPLNPDFFSSDIVLAPQFLKKQPVTAHDFKFYFDAVMNPHNQEPGAVSMRVYIEDIEEVEVIDPLTFVVRWNGIMDNGVPKAKYAAKFLTGELQPLACFVYQYYPDGSKIIEESSDSNVYRTNSVWAQQFSQHWAKNVIVSCGAWVFDGFNDYSIKLKRNENFYNPFLALTENQETLFKDTLEAIWQDFKANQIDYYILQPNQELELENFLKSPYYKKQEEEGASIVRLDHLARSYAYIGWNEATPLFSSKKVRQAMTMAIDRSRIIKQNLNGNGVEITAGFSPNSPSYNHNIEPWPYDPVGARLLLEQEGWYDSDGDGVIDKEIDGEVKPFRFHLTYFVKSSTSKSICAYIASALREIGVDCELKGVDVTDLSLLFDDKSFDAYLLSWALGSPPENPKQLWYSTGAKQKGSSNSVGFDNAEADKIIDRLEFESNHDKRLELYHRFHEILHEEQPYTFLYAPKTVLLYRSYIQNLFLPSEREDLIPGANVDEPDWSTAWIKH